MLASRQKVEGLVHLNGGKHNPLVVLVFPNFRVLTQNVHGIQTVDGEHVVEPADQFLLAVALGRRIFN